MERPVKQPTTSGLGGWVCKAQAVSGGAVPVRRLITLIFVDRDKPAIMVVIRRELPLTTVAGDGPWPTRIGSVEGSPVPWTLAAADRLRFILKDSCLPVLIRPPAATPAGVARLRSPQPR
jgi:hypothetical protein